MERRVLAASIGWSEEFTGVQGLGSKIRQPPRRSGIDGYFKVAGRCCGTECTRNPQTSVRYHSPRGGSVRVKSGERFATMESGPPLQDAVRVQDRGSLLLSSLSPLRRRVSLLSGSFARRKNCFPVGAPVDSIIQGRQDPRGTDLDGCASYPGFCCNISTFSVDPFAAFER